MQFLLQYSRKTITYAYSGASMGAEQLLLKFSLLHLVKDQIDKFLTVPQKALFYVRQTVANGWSRNVLHNFIDSSLYERHGKALSNFNRTLPDVDSDLVQEITKDPYNFAFAGITKPYNERILKDALLNNITKFLTELGTGRFFFVTQSKLVGTILQLWS